MAAKKEQKADRWEVRKGRKVWLASPIPYCGYNQKTLESLRSRGFKLYRNNELVK